MPYYPNYGYPNAYPPPQFSAPPNMGFMPYPMPPYIPPPAPKETEEDEDEEFDVMVKLIDKQRDILGRFVSTLNKNKDTLVNDRAKHITKQIKSLEKEGVIRQLKLNGEQSRLISKDEYYVDLTV